MLEQEPKPFANTCEAREYLAKHCKPVFKRHILTTLAGDFAMSLAEDMYKQRTALTTIAELPREHEADCNMIARFALA
jgi:hypothetical protein